MNTSLDISNNKSLLPLAKVVNAVQAAARDSGKEIILVGAAARDIRLTHMHGIPIDRATEDVDFAVMVDDWSDFEALRNSRIATGDFQQRSRAAHHRLRHRSGLPLDIVPFGGIERIDRTIVWPPDQSIIMDRFGMKEALGTCSLVRLPAGAEIDIPSIPALACRSSPRPCSRKPTHRQR